MAERYLSQRSWRCLRLQVARRLAEEQKSALPYRGDSAPSGSPLSCASGGGRPLLSSGLGDAVGRVASESIDNDGAEVRSGMLLSSDSTDDDSTGIRSRLLLSSDSADDDSTVMRSGLLLSSETGT